MMYVFSRSLIRTLFLLIIVSGCIETTEFKINEDLFKSTGSPAAVLKETLSSGGSATGGKTITVMGENLTSSHVIKIGGSICSTVSTSSTERRCITPSLPIGWYDIQLLDSSGNLLSILEKSYASGAYVIGQNDTESMSLGGLGKSFDRATYWTAKLSRIGSPNRLFVPDSGIHRILFWDGILTINRDADGVLFNDSIDANYLGKGQAGDIPVDV